jgi:SAM-dependent methyltransferase
MKTNKYLHDTFVHNTRAAERIVPFLTGLFKPASIIDVGCGTGTWLKIFLDQGIPVVKGIEGPHLDVSKLVIPADLVLLQDLEQPILLNEKFDMAISLEVAEHLNVAVAEQFIRQLTAMSDVVVFSAAIPYQGGQNHINEQWLGYWVGLFRKSGFIPHDIIRPKFWDDEDVEFWYKQNCCIFINENHPVEGLSQLPDLHCMDIVHPDLLSKLGAYRDRMWKGDLPMASLAKLLVKKAMNMFK